MPTFDLRTHETDPLTGKVTATNLYNLHIIGSTKYFERPVGSRNLFYENGETAGRLKSFTEVDTDAKHIEYKAPPTGAEMVNQRLSATQLELESARKEIEQMKAERENTIKKAQGAAKATAKA